MWALKHHHIPYIILETSIYICQTSVFYFCFVFIPQIYLGLYMIHYNFVQVRHWIFTKLSHWNVVFKQSCTVSLAFLPNIPAFRSDHIISYHIISGIEPKFPQEFPLSCCGAFLLILLQLSSDPIMIFSLNYSPKFLLFIVAFGCVAILSEPLSSIFLQILIRILSRKTHVNVPIIDDVSA